MFNRFEFEFLMKFYERKHESLYESLHRFEIQFAYDDSLNFQERRVSYTITNPWFSSTRALVLKFHIRSWLEKTLKENPQIQFTEFTNMLIETINKFSKQAYEGEKELSAHNCELITPHLCIFTSPDFTEEVSVLALTENASVEEIHWDTLNNFSHNVLSPYILGLEIVELSAIPGFRIRDALLSDYGDNIIQQRSSISEWLAMQRKDSCLRKVHKWIMEL